MTSLMCDMSLCRLCGQENMDGMELFPTAENETDLSKLVNKYLPLKVQNDKKYPTKICPGCNIQLEATVSFMDLIVQGQVSLRQLYKSQQDKLYRQEKQRAQLEQALKSVNPNTTVDTYTIQSDETGEKFLIRIFSQGPLFSPDHELSLRVEGLSQPRRKRGRPPKPQRTDEEDVVTSNSSNPVKEVEQSPEVFQDGKNRRRIKVPKRYSEAIQGKELDKVFKEEGVIDEEFVSDEDDVKSDEEGEIKVEEVIGRMESHDGEDLGQSVVVNRTSHKARRHKNKLVNRNKRHSARRLKYKCELCNRQFLHHGRYEIHKKTHDENRIAEDNQICNVDENGQGDKLDSPTVPASEDGNIFDELKSPEGQRKSFFCNPCNKPFSCKQNYEVHVRAVHCGERPYLCEICNKRFAYPHSLKIHQTQHRSNKSVDKITGKYKCPACPKLFRHPSSLQYHRESEHNDGRRYLCNKCDKAFKHRQLLQRHQTVHSNERPYGCSQCHAAFKTKANLILHKRTVHGGQRSYWCTLCEKAFVHSTALKLHQRWHAGIRPYQCEFCDKTFSQKGNLTEHRRIHTGEKPYQCHFCGRAFTTSSQFRLHTKSHLNERPYKCEDCEKSFLHKDTWRCHVRRHLDERPFKCDRCPKAFLEAWTLKKHQRVHTGDKPYKCDMCPKTFADGSNLTKHKKIHRNCEDKQLLLVTYENEGEAIVTYVEPQEDPITDSNSVVQINEEEENVKTIQLQQLVDQEGNPISFITQDGQQVKVVTSNEEGQTNIQGLLPDGTLVPISLTLPEKNKSTLGNVDDTTQKLDVPLLPTDIQFLGAEEGKVQFINEDNQNILVTTYNIEDAINPQYISLN